MVPCHRVVASDLTIGGLVHHLTMNNWNLRIGNSIQKF
jgi:O6-methylguanine-DNA--protein-cysteine methyltransferase